MYDEQRDTVWGNKGDFWMIAHSNNTFEVLDIANNISICNGNNVRISRNRTESQRDCC